VPRKVIIDAMRDIDAGLVDTGLRSTPGLDARQRSKLVRAVPKVHRSPDLQLDDNK
jgi:hypothetical protein